eukprot:TRINITY_DN3931_c0_g1_i1.p1 TRINITY_DN3931_c0_g1~~TRINITY_DN3931_c0_g1_i1.p1  ORF type:complete len:202 (-),score=16.49 TRINITY_DN3931_c0_g1_i1:87-692(-)
MFVIAVCFVFALSSLLAHAIDSTTLISAVQVNESYKIEVTFSENGTNRMGISIDSEIKNCQQIRIFSDDTLRDITDSGTFSYSCTWLSDNILVITYNEQVDDLVSSLDAVTFVGESIKSSLSPNDFVTGTVPFTPRIAASSITSAKSMTFGSEIGIQFSQSFYPSIGNSIESQPCSLIFLDADILLGGGSMCRIGSIGDHI